MLKKSFKIISSRKNSHVTNLRTEGRRRELPDVTQFPSPNPARDQTSLHAKLKTQHNDDFLLIKHAPSQYSLTKTTFHAEYI